LVASDCGAAEREAEVEHKWDGVAVPGFVARPSAACWTCAAWCASAAVRAGPDIYEACWGRAAGIAGSVLKAIP
jgi:hypothetical protein